MELLLVSFITALVNMILVIALCQWHTAAHFKRLMIAQENSLPPESPDSTDDSQP